MAQCRCDAVRSKIASVSDAVSRFACRGLPVGPSKIQPPKWDISHVSSAAPRLSQLFRKTPQGLGKLDSSQRHTQLSCSKLEPFCDTEKWAHLGWNDPNAHAKINQSSPNSLARVQCRQNSPNFRPNSPDFAKFAPKFAKLAKFRFTKGL